MNWEEHSRLRRLPLCHWKECKIDEPLMASLEERSRGNGSNTMSETKEDRTAYKKKKEKEVGIMHEQGGRDY